MHPQTLSILAAFLFAGANAQYTATYDPNNLPPTTENDQIGTNQCGTGSNQTSVCQNLYVNSIQDFCLWSPPEPNSAIGAVEQIVVAWCTLAGRGTRVFPDGTLGSAHFVETPDYIQVTGMGTFTKTNILAGDAGGELDPHGADGMGNPHGGLVFSNVWNNGTHGLGEQLHEWTNFMSDQQFCIRVCKEAPNGPTWCQHIYDTTGCQWNMPGDYGDGFTSCQGDSGIPMGLYPQADGSTSTFHQGEGATPAAHPAPSVSNCQTYQSSVLYAATAAVTPTTSVAMTGHTSSAPAATGNSNAHTGGAVSTSSSIPFTFITLVLGLFAGATILV